MARRWFRRKRLIAVSAAVAAIGLVAFALVDTQGNGTTNRTGTRAETLGTYGGEASQFGAGSPASVGTPASAHMPASARASASAHASAKPGASAKARTPGSSATPTSSGSPTGGAGAPAPTAVPAGSCSAAANMPGGADPWGGCWPGPQNTGVPAGTALTNVPQQVSSGKGWTWNTGDQAIYVTSCNVTLDSLNVDGAIYLRDGNGTSSASTPCVTIKNSKINGFVDVDDYCLVSQCGPLVMTDDEIAIQGGADRSSLLYTNWFAWRINSHGGHGTMACSGHCEVHDSWIHGFYLEQAFHYNAVGSNGDGAGPFVIDHNYMSCGDFEAKDPDTNGTAGCSADLGLYGDFDPIENVTISQNYFAPATPSATYPDSYQPGFCINTNNPQVGKAYPNATNEVVINNIFARGPSGTCGTYGPVSSWQGGNGNVWSGNKWDNGKPLNMN